ncbi:hypothetical protein HS7_03590 [Sulfolobales archaeon HS-7]|nr:hypothetical protein HS7_03590 [Sulfolobales archaeon HS-7]
MLLAVDGGATKTVAVIYRSGEILGVGLGGSGNFTEVGISNARSNVMEAINEALSWSSAKISDIERGVFALAGIGDSEEFTRIGTELAKGIITNSLVVNDGVGCYRMSNLNYDGGVFAPGTGSVGFIQLNGNLKRIGGWGWIFGDEGSAINISKRAIIYATRVIDGLEEDSEIPYALERFSGLPFREAVTFLTKEKDKRKIASFAPVIDKLAQNGDRIALKVIYENAEYIKAVILRLRRTVDRVSIVGGVMRSQITRKLLEGLNLKMFFGYYAVIGGIVYGGEMVDEGMRDDLISQMREYLTRIPETRLRKYLFVDSKVQI